MAGPSVRLGRRLLALFAALALVAAACGDDPLTDDDGAQDTTRTAPATEPDDDEADDTDRDAAGVDRPFERVEGAISTADHPSEDGLDLWRSEVPEIEDVRIPASAGDDREQPALWLEPQGDDDGDVPLLVVLHSFSYGYTFAGVVSFVPMYDLVEWDAFNRTEAGDPTYADDLESACGGDPQTDEEAAEDCRDRSPVAHLGDLADGGTPVLLAHGIDDDEQQRRLLQRPRRRRRAHQRRGPRPPRPAPGARRPRGDVTAESSFDDQDPEVLFVRSTDDVRFVMFDGAHDFVLHPGLRWVYELACGDPGI